LLKFDFLFYRREISWFGLTVALNPGSVPGLLDKFHSRTNNYWIQETSRPFLNRNAKHYIDLRTEDHTTEYYGLRPSSHCKKIYLGV
jgi:hypothetical protein